MQCKFITISENQHRCETCGFVIKTEQSPERVYRNCRPNGEKPRVLEMAKQFVTATVKEIVSTESVSPETVDLRRKICGECEHFRENRCNLCGCFVQLKIEYATAKCPINKW